MRYKIITYGCQMNKSDSERIAAVLESIGYQPAPHQSWWGADLILVNACSVRQSAIDRIWGQINRFQELKIKNKKLKTILTGCVLNEDKVKLKKRVDLILDIKDLPKWPQKLNLKTKKLKNAIRLPWQSYGVNRDYLGIEPKYQSLSTAFVPIMTGCNNFCTFCAVPYTRGREISRPAEEIICEVGNLVKRGYKEIWLLGQNVNSYKSRGINFPKLLKMVNDTPGNFWIRFASSHPKDFSNELIEAMAESKKVTEYLNLPAQSGDNEILKRMNRPYKIEYYKNLVKKIRKVFAKIRGKFVPISISTDVIVGFPGETKKQFENTVKLFKEIKFDMAYIAQYSPRPGTQAAKMKDNVPPKEKERRWKVLTEILRQTALVRNESYVGKEAEVLVNEQKKEFLIGKTKAYKTMEIQNTRYKIQDTNLVGQFVKVKIKNALPWGLKGELICLIN